MMEQSSDNSAEQGYRSATMPTASPGKILREARERLGLSVADVANQTKFATRQVEALEADNFRQLQGATFVRGFVRSYAKILNLDAQSLIEQLPSEMSAPQQPKPTAIEVAFPTMLPSRRQNLIWSGAAFLVAVIVVIFGLWHSSTPPQPSETAKAQAPEAQTQTTPIKTPIPLSADAKVISDLPVSEAPIEELKPDLSKFTSSKARLPSPAPEPQALPLIATQEIKLKKPANLAQETEVRANNTEAEKVVTSSKSSTLRLVFGDESWTEIKNADGKIISSQVNQPGSELLLKGRPPFTMLIGRALSVRLYQDDEQVDLAPYINKYSEVAHVTLE